MQDIETYEEIQGLLFLMKPIMIIMIMLLTQIEGQGQRALRSLGGLREIQTLITLNFTEIAPQCSPYSTYKDPFVHLRRFHITTSSNNTEQQQQAFDDAARPGSPVDAQQELLDKALQLVPQLGWSNQALETAADQLGLSRAIVGSLPRREGDLISYFNDNCNDRLKDLLTSTSEELSAMRIRDRVAQGVKHRLEMIQPYKSSWSDALAVQTQPQNLPASLKNYASITDMIWRYAAGDRSTDFSWYTKRALLTGVYISTELCMIGDVSANERDTWEFMERRLDDVLLLGKTIGEGGGNSKGTVDNEE
jgi:ubiquinone biosynthesis protein COQ9